jgi:ATP-dependent exoDNAse (exonuclease V) alpha subunit
MKWSPQQETALKSVGSWFKDGSEPIFRVFGYAGTGKTTLARHFAQHIKGVTCYAAYTGKAALVMRKNGCHGATTIHSLIYKPVEQDDGTVVFQLNYESPLKNAALLVIDECSMVDEALAKDLLTFGVPILVLGDPAQLPPVSGAGFFTEKTPDVMLTEIHRQAAENPIIYMATKVRNGEQLKVGNYGSSRVIGKGVVSSEEALNVGQILVGRNQTRELMNNKIRRLKGWGQENDFPVKGDKLICLKNDKNLGIYNGGIFDTLGEYTSKNKSDKDFCLLSLKEEDSGKTIRAKVHKSFFASEFQTPDWKYLKGTQEFDFGYAITCHKSQGSQWADVLIYDESWCFREQWARWLYTSITRAADIVTIVKS